MKTERNEQIERIEKFLNERWYIANMPDARPQDVSYYNGLYQTFNIITCLTFPEKIIIDELSSIYLNMK